MPFYEYECPSCRYYLEVLQKISDPPLRKCPSCRKAGFKRLMSAPVFRLKGSGWYETDFKSDKEGQRNLAGAEPVEAKEAAPEAKAGGDDKAAKPEAAPADTTAAKKESAKPAEKSEAPRKSRLKRTVKRPAVRAGRKSARAPKRGSRRR